MKSKSALVSIIIPVFNQTETYMRECLESVFRQSHDNIEIVISDNHSTNGIGNYLVNVSNQNQKIKLVKPDTFISMIENFIYAFKHASGDFLCPLSSDDIIFPDHVETLLSGFYRESNLAFSCSAPLFFKESISEKWVPNVYNTGFYEGHSFAQLCLKHGGCSFGAILIRRDLFIHIGGFDSQFNYAFDVDLIFRLLCAGDVVFYNRPTSAIRLWERQEQQNRRPESILDLSRLFRKINKEHMYKGDLQLIKHCQKALMLGAAAPIPAYIFFRKGDTSIHLKTAENILAHYSNFWINLILKNKYNIIGISISLTWLTFVKIKWILKNSFIKG